MDTREHIVALEAKIKASGLRVDDVLAHAKVNRSTWTRWKAELTVPHLDKWWAVERAINDLASKEVAS